MKSQSFRVMMNVGEEGGSNNQTVVFLPSGISFQLMCGGVGRARLHWVFASNETTPAVVHIDQLPPQELEPFDLRPDPSGPDLSFASFSTETEDDQMAILNVPVMSLLPDDRTELRITDARTQLNTSEADCTAIGTLTVIRP